MSSQETPKHAAQPSDTDFEATDCGWDPYVTSLMLEAADAKSARAADEDDAVPVMSFSRTEAKRGR